MQHLVLFDIDGTLLHSGGCGRAATRLAIQDVFGTVGVLDNVDFGGKTDWQILHEALGPAGISEKTIAARIPVYKQTVARRLAEIIADFPVRPCVGAPQVVAALAERAYVLLGLVTGNMEPLAPIKLRAAGYDPRVFKVGAYGSEGWNRDMLPPLALQRAREYAGVDFPPQRVVIVGDTPRDVACAASIGARTVAVATGWYDVPTLQAEHPTHVFETLEDTERVLHAILNHDVRR